MDSVRHFFDLERGEYSCIVDDKPFREHSAELRRQVGDGIIRDKKGRAVAQLALSIPEAEFKALKAIGDEDLVAWFYHGDQVALRRLVIRYPHWLVADGSVLRRRFGQ